MIICLAVSALAAKDNEVHYHYHMPGSSINSSKKGHLNEALCDGGADMRYAACILRHPFDKVEKGKCHNILEHEQRVCANQNQEHPQENNQVEHLSSKPQHAGVKQGWCKFKAWNTYWTCLAGAGVGGSAVEKSAKKAACESNWAIAKAQCNTARLLKKLQNRSLSTEEHLLFCATGAKNSWFWCEFWAKLRGGDQKQARLNACDNTYNQKMAVCNNSSVTVSTTTTSARF